MLLKGVLQKYGMDGCLHCCLEEAETHTVMGALREEEGGGQFAQETTARKILEASYWWPTLFRDVHWYLQRCNSCHRQRRPGPSSRHPLVLELPLAPFKKWGIDFIGPFTPITRRGGKRYINLAIDYATKRVEARATTKDDANATAHFLYEQIFTRFGPPFEIVSAWALTFSITPLSI